MSISKVFLDADRLASFTILEPELLTTRSCLTNGNYCSIPKLSSKIVGEYVFEVKATNRYESKPRKGFCHAKSHSSPGILPKKPNLPPK